MSDLAKKLRELRAEQGLTQREAARHLGISHSRLSDYEAGFTHGTKRPAVPDRELLARVANYYTFPFDVLLTLAGYPLTESTPLPVPETAEIEAQEVAEIYRRLSEPQRRLFLRVARAFKSDIEL